MSKPKIIIDGLYPAWLDSVYSDPIYTAMILMPDSLVSGDDA